MCLTRLIYAEQTYSWVFQCACDDDKAEYKQILRRWISIQPLEYRVIYHWGTTESKLWPPCSHRYLAMAYIDQYFMTEPSGYIGIALCPETALDAREMAVWLDNLLRHIHREVTEIHFESRFYNLHSVLFTEIP